MRSDWRWFMALPLFLSVVLGFTPGQFDMASMMMVQAQPRAMFNRREIRRELKLTRDQEHQIDDLMKIPNMQRSKDQMADMAANAQAFGTMQENEAKMYGLLDPDQKKRYDELHWQMVGAVAISEPAVQKALEMDSRTMQKVEEIRKQGGDQLLDMMRHGMGMNGQKKIEAISKDEEAKLMALLDDKQKAKLVELHGTPFKGIRPRGFFPL